MSLNVVEKSERKRTLKTCISLWPLGLLLLLLAVSVRLALHYWPDIMLQSVIWQKSMHQQMSALLEAVHASPHQAGLSLLAFSLVYGILHAVGPGHGKVVITTYLATHPAQLKNSLKLTLASSLLQGVVAITLVSVTLGLLQLSSRALHTSGFWMEKASFALVASLGLWLSVRALKRLWRAFLRARTANVPVIQRVGMRLSSASASPLVSVRQPQHKVDCDCGHRHLPSQDELHRGDDWRTRLAIVCAMGLRPCSGAILVLLFAKVIDVFLWGIASALAMALGTAITLSLLAVLVFYCRRVIERWGTRRAPALWQHMAWGTLSLAGGLLLLGVGVLLYLSAQPAMTGGIRPFG